MLPGSNLVQSGSADEFPKTLVRTLCQGSVVTSMDFHPNQQTLLLRIIIIFKNLELQLDTKSFIGCGLICLSCVLILYFLHQLGLLWET